MKSPIKWCKEAMEQVEAMQAVCEAADWFIQCHYGIKAMAAMRQVGSEQWNISANDELYQSFLEAIDNLKAALEKWRKLTE